jgi:hypothetical protein
MLYFLQLSMIEEQAIAKENLKEDMLNPKVRSNPKTLT